MLIDTVLQHPIVNVDARMDPHLRERMARAAKFDLASDFAAAADALSNDFVAIEKALPFCRLPFASTWVEVAQEHRPTFVLARTHLPALQAKPNRVGFLLQATKGDLSAFNAYLFWELKDHRGVAQACNMSMHFDPKAMLAVDESILDRPNAYQWIEPGIAPGWLKAPKHVRAKLVASVTPGTPPYLDPVFAEAAGSAPQLFYEIGIADWSGEAVFLLGVLALLNTVNVSEVKPVNLDKLNASRAKQRKPLLANHSVVTIHPRVRRHILGVADAHGHRALTAHLVRGHFKVRKTGIYFWRPYVRGSDAVEPKPKTYRVE